MPKPVVYAPTCSQCGQFRSVPRFGEVKLSYLVYDGQNQMHCPQCNQVYSCLVPPENYLDVATPAAGGLDAARAEGGAGENI